MKAVGRFIIIEPEKDEEVKTDGGLLISNKNSDDRYVRGKVISIGDESIGVKEGDVILYDKNAKGQASANGKTYQVIEIRDVVMVL